MDGILIIDKPEGLTSHGVVSAVRRMANQKKVGHAGTLDPLATGVLPVLLGSATRVSDMLTDSDKGYTAGLTLGTVTDTDDITGNVLSRREGPLPSAEEVRTAAAQFVRTFEQIPPMYSAIKVGGRKLYQLARAGMTAERTPRTVTVTRLDVLPENEQAGMYRLEIDCSKGTYVRTICHDIGEALGCGGTMHSLIRRKSGPFTLDAAVTLNAAREAAAEGRLESLLTPVEELFVSLRAVQLIPFYERLARNGAEIYLKRAHIEAEEGERLRVCGADGQFFAVGRVLPYPDGLAIRMEKSF